MTMPLILNQSAMICSTCFSYVQPHTHGAHKRVCSGVIVHTIPPPVTRGLPGDWIVPVLGNGWTQQAGQSPQTAYRATLDSDLQIILAVVPGTYGQPVFTIQPGWIPVHTMSMPACDPVNLSVLVVTVQGMGDALPGAVVVTRSGTPPATVDAAIRIPLSL